MIDVLQDFGLRLTSASVLFFDMDGTLVNTNFANYLSYKESVQQVMQFDIGVSYNPDERFNREALKQAIPNLTEAEYEKIVQMKNEVYLKYLSETSVNDSVADILKKYSKTNKTVLVTKCQEERAHMTLEYHGLITLFSHMFYFQKTHKEEKINKYENALNSLIIRGSSVFVFEKKKKLRMQSLPEYRIKI